MLPSVREILSGIYSTNISDWPNYCCSANWDRSLRRSLLYTSLSYFSMKMSTILNKNSVKNQTSPWNYINGFYWLIYDLILFWRVFPRLLIMFHFTDLLNTTIPVLPLMVFLSIYTVNYKAKSGWHSNDLISSLEASSEELHF